MVFELQNYEVSEYANYTKLTVPGFNLLQATELQLQAMELQLQAMELQLQAMEVMEAKLEAI